MKSLRTHRGAAEKNKRLAYLRGKLLERRSLLLENLHMGVRSTLEETHSPGDETDLANSQLAQDTEFEIGSLEYRAVAEIDNALRRLESGKYGICEDCGRRIPAARLKALPFAYLCIQCKERQEREESASDAFALEWNPLDELTGGEANEDSVPTYRGSKVY